MLSKTRRWHGTCFENDNIIREETNHHNPVTGRTQATKRAKKTKKHNVSSASSMNRTLSSVSCYGRQQVSPHSRESMHGRKTKKEKRGLCRNRICDQLICSREKAPQKKHNHSTILIKELAIFCGSVSSSKGMTRTRSLCRA